MGGHKNHYIPPELKHTSLVDINYYYNCQSLNLMNTISCVVNGRLFCFNYGGKLDLLHINKINIACWKIFTSVLFFKITEIIWNKMDSDGLCVSIFIKDVVCYLGVIEKLHTDDFF